MELEHSFTVPVPKSRAWDVLLDVERVAPCMPGASLDSVDGDEIHGRIKVKVGPINMMYAGTARFIERDEDAGIVTLEASGKETRGAGTASASVRSVLEDRWRGNPRHRADDAERDRQAGPVRPRRDERGRRETAQHLRREPRRHAGRAGRRRVRSERRNSCRRNSSLRNSSLRSRRGGPRSDGPARHRSRQHVARTGGGPRPPARRPAEPRRTVPPRRRHQPPTCRSMT